MANYTLDPDATPSAPDDLTEWGTYADIDDAVRDPTDASTGGDGSALAKTNGLFTRTTRVELTTDTITGTVSQAVVRIYANTQTNCTITANLKAGGSWIGQQTIVAAGHLYDEEHPFAGLWQKQILVVSSVNRLGEDGRHRHPGRYDRDALLEELTSA